MDSELLHRARRGDAQAFEALMSAYEKKVYGLCLRMMGNPHDGEDAAQEAMLRIWQRMGQCREDAAFSTWVYRVTTSVCCDALRKRRGDVSLDALREDGLEPSDPADTPQAFAEAGERRQALSRAIAGIPEDMRLVFLLRDVHGLSVEQTSRALRISQGTVKSRLARAREKIALALSREGFSGKEGRHANAV